jgi:hypothetical protein
MNQTKAWWMSKTVWTNLIALIGSIVVAAGFDPGRWAEIATVSLAVVNLGLRLVTKDEISLTGEEER